MLRLMALPSSGQDPGWTSVILLFHSQLKLVGRVRDWKISTLAVIRKLVAMGQLTLHDY